MTTWQTTACLLAVGALRKVCHLVVATEVSEEDFLDQGHLGESGLA